MPGAPALARSRASRTSALPLAYCSQQPWLPHSHGWPPSTTCMWPNSPPIPLRPRCTCPPSTRPPPIPVPSVMHTRSDSFCAAPNRHSRPRSAVRVVLDEGRQADAPAHSVAQGLVAPGEVRREEHRRRVGVDEARRADADGDHIVAAAQVGDDSAIASSTRRGSVDGVSRVVSSRTIAVLVDNAGLDLRAADVDPDRQSLEHRLSPPPGRSSRPAVAARLPGSPDRSTASSRMPRTASSNEPAALARCSRTSGVIDRAARARAQSGQ